jgi:hydrogenase-4 component F
MLIAFLLLPWALSTLIAVVVRPYRLSVGWANVALGGVSLVAAVLLWRGALSGGATVAGPDNLLRVDALSALVAFCVATVATLAACSGPGLEASAAGASEARQFRIFANGFALAMLLAVTIDNVAMMWVAIEATTITSAILIPLHRTKASVEASWKYILIGSVGIALAFGGTVLAYFDFVSLTGRREGALNWTVLNEVAPTLHPDILRLAFIFLLVGYGTKAGLAPMHTWLPDAHSEAPAPLSAMMSGVLLAVAHYAILRWKTVVDLAGGSGFTNPVLLALALASIAIGALSLVRQPNYKRMLAYSSVEHSGLICMGLTFGPAGVFASLLHLLNHAVAKSMSFLLSGRILRRYGSAELADVSGVLRVQPATGALFGIGVLALMGLPPFGLFVSEFLLFRAGFAAGRPWATSAALVLTGIGFIALAGNLVRMLYGAPREDMAGRGEATPGALVPLVACAVALVALGLFLPDAVTALLGRIAGTASR